MCLRVDILSFTSCVIGERLAVYWFKLVPETYWVAGCGLWLSRRAAGLARQSVITGVAGAVCGQRHCDLGCRLH
ncbi:hypothetical protein HmCmsJML007_02626 [Escherichia coli]|nr:hypothetical protein HmCmsJML007_02626 [Escherichia coli]